MSAQIISMQAWRVAHSERPALCLELLRGWMWPVRVWLASALRYMRVKP